MLSNFFSVGTQVVILFLLIAVGYSTNKLKIFSAAAIKEITTFVLYFVCPSTIIIAFQKDYTPELLRDVGVGILISTLTMCSMIVLGRLLIHHKDERRKTVLKFGTIFSNAAFMAIPLQTAILGDAGVFYGAAYIAVFNTLVWTHGVCIMGGGIKAVSIKKIIFNVNIIAVVLGVLFFIFRVKIPKLVYSPMNYLASLNTPLPMIIIGYHLANAKLGIDSFAEVVAMLLRFFVSPLVMLGLCRLTHANPTMSVALIIAASAPFATNTTMLSDMFGGGDVPYSAGAVSLTTLLSIFTMPVMVAIAML